MTYKSYLGYEFEYPYKIASDICRGFTKEFPNEDLLREFVSTNKQIWDAFVYAESRIIELDSENKKLRAELEFLYSIINNEVDNEK